MRRLALAVIAMLGLVVVPVTAAHADPSAGPSLPVPSASPGQMVCTVDSNIYGLTGLVTTADGYAVINRGNTGASYVYLLNNSCQRIGSPIRYTGSPRGGAYDPRDLAVSADGSAYWVADTGDDVAHPTRSTVAVWKLPTNGKTGAIYHLSYPAGDVHDADAMLMTGDGTPILISRVVSGASGIYLPSAPLDATKTVPLTKVGEFTPQNTNTDNRFGPTGRQMVTGGANSPDGKHVVLRTYSDAYEWSVPDGDVVKAITTTTPVITPLPSEPQGEAIAYTRDGKSFVTVSSQDDGVKTQILSYRPAVPANPTKAGSVPGGGAAAPKGDTRGWFSKLSLEQLTYLVGGVGGIGLLMVISGVLGIRAARKRAQQVSTMRSRPDDGWPDDEEHARTPAGTYPVPDSRYPQHPQHDQDRYQAQSHASMDYPSARGSEYRGGVYSSSGYDTTQGYDDGGSGAASGHGTASLAPQQGGTTYRAGRSGQETGHYEDGERRGPYSHGGQRDT
jgi:hypothetical protein